MKLRELCEKVTSSVTKELWAGAEYFPMKGSSCGIYLSVDRIKDTDKAVYISESRDANKIARAAIVLLDALEDKCICLYDSNFPDPSICDACHAIQNADKIAAGGE